MAPRRYRKSKKAVRQDLKRFDRKNMLLYACSVACDSVAAERAIATMDVGETILLVESGRVFSYMRYSSKQHLYVEKKV